MKSWETIAEIFHYNQESKQYKKLSILRTDRDTIVLQAREGEKGKYDNLVTLQLDEKEIAYLATKLFKLL